MKSRHGLILAAMLLASLSIPALATDKVVQEADAWNHSTCKWSGTSTTWKNGNLTTALLDDTKFAIAFWNDVGANFFLDNDPTNGKITYYRVSRSDVTWAGLFTGFCTNGIFTSGTILLNTYIMGTAHDNVQNVAGHETGHALGLGHTEPESDGGSAIMWPTMQSSIIAATVDDIRGLMARYGKVLSTSQCNEFKTNGDVVHTGTCSGSNPAMPIREYIITAGSTSKAVATTTATATSLPSNNALLITVNVTATTLRKFSMGIYTSTDIANVLNDVMTIEMDNDGWYLQRSSPTGYIKKTISSTPPTVGTQYFVELVVRNGQPSKAYVFINNGGPNDPPFRIGSIQSETVAFPWSTGVFYGTGVWTISSSDAKSDYSVKEFYNRLKSWT
ncbi:MAG: matrixin family metalloprotease [Nitrososphaera sp.]